MLINLRTPSLATLAVIQVLATSCGGGGGGVYSVGSEVSNAISKVYDPMDGGEDLASSDVRNELQSSVGSETLATLALTEPKEGSVSQSSNFDEVVRTETGATVTVDDVTVTGLDGVYAVLSEESSTEASISGAISSVTIAVSGGNVAITLSVSPGYIRRDSVTVSTTDIEIENGNVLSAAEVFVAYGLPGNTDWAAVGIWIHGDVTSTAAADWNLGVFADTSTPTPNGLNRFTGRYSYTGGSIGYAVTQDDADQYHFYTFTADAELDANFDDNNINGRILKLHSPDLDAEDFNDDVTDVIIYLEDVTLEDDNFFKGSVKVGTDELDDTFGQGNWGGQFFGDNAEGIIGTYGSNIGDGFIEGLKKASFGGSFIAVLEYDFR